MMTSSKPNEQLNTTFVVETIHSQNLFGQSFGYAIDKWNPNNQEKHQKPKRGNKTHLF